MRPTAPAPTSPVYETRSANETVPLYSGDLELIGPSYSFSGHGTVGLSWLPSPRLAFEISGDARAGGQFPYGDLMLRLVALGAEAVARVQSSTTRLGSPGRGETNIRGSLEQVLIGDSTIALAQVLFHIPNFPKFDGSPLEVPVEAGKRIWRGRVELVVGDWQIILDERPELTLETGSGTVLDLGGYAFTHTGSLRRLDGASFVASQASKVLEALGCALSFAAGRRTYPLLPVGFSGDEQVWQQWDAPSVEPWTERVSWFPRQIPNSLESVVGGALQRLADWDWRDTLMFALGSFCEANGRASLEPSLVLAQTGLELLAWAILVLEEGMLSSEGFGKLAAHDRLRLLLSITDTPRDVPPLLDALRERAQRDGIDGPEVLTVLRNKIVHPPRRGVFRSQDIDELSEGSLLALWYLELAILRFLGYQGLYVSRVSPARFSGRAETVPWQSSSSPEVGPG
jgi:hypothetical protein